MEAQHRAPDTPGPGPEEVGPDPSAIPQQQDDSSAPAEVDVQPLATEGKEGEATEAADEGPPDAPGDTTDVLADAGEAAEAASDAPVALNEVPEKRGDVAEELSAAPKEDPAEPDNEGEAVDHVDDPPQGTEEPPEWANTIVEEAAEVVEAADGDPKDDGERPELAEETYREADDEEALGGDLPSPTDVGEAPETQGVVVEEAAAVLEALTTVEVEAPAEEPEETAGESTSEVDAAVGADVMPNSSPEEQSDSRGMWSRRCVLLDVVFHTRTSRFKYI